MYERKQRVLQRCTKISNRSCGEEYTTADQDDAFKFSFGNLVSQAAVSAFKNWGNLNPDGPISSQSLNQSLTTTSSETSSMTTLLTSRFKSPQIIDDSKKPDDLNLSDSLSKKLLLDDDVIDDEALNQEVSDEPPHNSTNNFDMEDEDANLKLSQLDDVNQNLQAWILSDNFDSSKTNITNANSILTCRQTNTINNEEAESEVCGGSQIIEEPLIATVPNSTDSEIVNDIDFNNFTHSYSNSTTGYGSTTTGLFTPSDTTSGFTTVATPYSLSEDTCSATDSSEYLSIIKTFYY